MGGRGCYGLLRRDISRPTAPAVGRVRVGPPGNTAGLLPPAHFQARQPTAPASPRHAHLQARQRWRSGGTVGVPGRGPWRISRRADPHLHHTHHAPAVRVDVCEHLFDPAGRLRLGAEVVLELGPHPPHQCVQFLPVLGGLGCLDVRACRARDSISRRANDAPAGSSKPSQESSNTPSAGPARAGPCAPLPEVAATPAPAPTACRPCPLAAEGGRACPGALVWGLAAVATAAAAAAVVGSAVWAVAAAGALCVPSVTT